MVAQNGRSAEPSSTGLKLRMLDLEQVRRIDELLASLGPFGELHLIVQHGELRSISRAESLKAWKGNGGPGATT